MEFKLFEAFNSEEYNNLIKNRVPSKFDKWIDYDFGGIRTYAIPFEDIEENQSMYYEAWNFIGRQSDGKYAFMCTSDPYNRHQAEGMILKFDRFNDVARHVALPGRRY